MDFSKKTWQDRQSQYPDRRKLTETDTTNVYEVERAEGEILEAGHQFNAENMNDLEKRIYSGFTTLYGADVKIKDENGYFTASKLDGVLDELFTYADSGKKAIVSAIGATRNGTPVSSETFDSLANRVKNDKVSYYQRGAGSFTTSSGSHTRTWDISPKFAVEGLSIYVAASAIFLDSKTEDEIWLSYNGFIGIGAGNCQMSLPSQTLGSAKMAFDVTLLPSAAAPTSLQVKITTTSSFKGILSNYKLNEVSGYFSSIVMWGKIS